MILLVVLLIGSLDDCHKQTMGKVVDGVVYSRNGVKETQEWGDGCEDS